MAATPYRTTPESRTDMPPGIPYIVGNECAERFSFYGMRTALLPFMVHYLHLMGQAETKAMSGTEATKHYHTFMMAAYLLPFFGAILADAYWGKYRTILYLSLAYCVGHGLLAMMGGFGNAHWLLVFGLFWISIGAGGIKSCVAAHVGDQFGKSNRHLLERVFNYFYWSINLGAFVSSLLTPWLLEWYGPHLAFGVPGVLMAVATVVFWMGRWKFIHIQAKGEKFVKEVFSKDGLYALGKLILVYYIFISMFWALYDQTGSSWVLQAEDMDLNFMGIEWLPAQVQSINPILILLFIPLFTFWVYPAINRVFPLTPLRKMAIGFFVMTLGFSVVAISQQWIDAGERPSIGWQLLAFVLVTAAEVMISIVGLEFSYTQAPKSMKSLVLGVWYFAVFLGNGLTTAVNGVIEVRSPLAEVKAEQTETKTERLPGFDKLPNTADDIVVKFENGRRASLEFASQPVLNQAADALLPEIEKLGWRTPPEEFGAQVAAKFQDPWGRPLQYSVINRNQCRLASPGPGPKGELKTPWEEGVVLHITPPEPPKKDSWLARVERSLRPERSWLDRRKEELGIREAAGGDESRVSRDYYVGGQVTLEGASYFWFFTALMGVFAGLFLLVLRYYKTKDYIHEEEEPAEAKA